ncbi:MAG TPA: cupin domain-containing protein [Verrucomicrobiae bacterium]|nr:cupin domain-containing protein [Verrucomicrobiae bacterium]
MRMPLLSNPVLVLPGDGQQLNVIGDCQVLKLDGSQTGGAFSLIEQSYRPGAGVPLHFHTQEDAVFYMIEGHMDFVVGDRRISADAGATVLLPRGVPHASRAGERGARALVTLFPAGGEKMFLELHAIAPGDPDREKAKAVCKKFGVHFL